MTYNPYQKIIKDGALIQQGEMDTPVKFGQLTEGVDLVGKRVLDVGCNLGAMCNIATVNGATAFGIDINLEYINQAKQIFPNLKFQCLEAESIYGSYDIIIASAMLHYIKNLDVLFKAFARCTKMVLCDVWLNDSTDPIFTLSHRDIYIPSRSAFLNITGKYFSTIEEKGLALTPDQSKRYIFHLSNPKPDSPKAVLIYGEGATGKTTLSRTYFGYNFIMTDNISTSWYRHTRNNIYSVKWAAEYARGNHLSEYLDFFINNLKGWLWDCGNRDIVIEGYELIFDDFRETIIDFLNLNGWEVSITKLEKAYDKDYT